MKVLVIHGPNLNMLGKREPEHYGNLTLEEIDSRIRELSGELDMETECFQSNSESGIVERIQQGGSDIIIIKPAAFTHTSIAIRDALLLLKVPIVEIHLSNIYKREPFRHKSMIADIVAAQISGFGAAGYRMALDGLSKMILSNIKSG